MSTCMRGQSPPSTVSASTSATSAVLLRVHRISQAGPAVPFIHNGFFYSVAPRGRMTSGQLAHHGWDVVQQTAFQVFNTPAPTPLFQCKICLSSLPLKERVIFQECRDPNHGCCRECTGKWIEERVLSGHIHGLLCSRRGMVECEAALKEDEILRLAGPEILAKYKRFVEMGQDATVRECPRCKRMCKPKLLQGEIQAEMHCPSCGGAFCYYHSNAHAGRSCNEYSQEIARQEKEMQSGALADSKQCPNCGVHTVRTSGCNHMVCAERTCGADWCWCCGAEIQGGANGVAEHYSTGPCQQFPDLTPTPGCWLSCIQLVTWPFKWCFLLLGLLLFIFCLLITPVSLTIILTFPCFFHVRLRSQQAFKSLILLPGCIVYLFFCLLWNLVSGLLLLAINIVVAPVLRCMVASCTAIDIGIIDHTHFIWVWKQPLMALEEGRPWLQCYFRKWTWWPDFDSDSDTSSSESGGSSPGRSP
ncbi:Probable E3 ubiquitin-protein ligase RNF217 (IBR domain-containing protein 1) (RING finger protein 217) [Durusdinium trenchii]|uniref:RBR-type E3 ubiquitin transferase n=1 Tax=Durusdinium trenchii TaxID=1381693 RepID=A0ABP0L3H1_9DINO